MTKIEKKIVEEGIAEAKIWDVKVVLPPLQVRSIRPIKDLKAMFALIWLISKEKPDIGNAN
jgi:hypothetical protein